VKSQSPMSNRLTDCTLEIENGELNPVAARLGERVAQETSAMCVQHFGPALRAVILTGSLARGEGSLSSDGTPGKLASDAEFIVVLRDSVPLPELAKMARLTGDIEQQLAVGGVECHLALSCAHDDFLLKMQPHIFAYETKFCGKIIMGEADILSLIPAFVPTMIPLEDAWRLVSNRMVEMAEVLAASGSVGVGPVPPEVFYRTLKLYLDMATSLLLFAGAYAPSYQERCKNLHAVVENGQNMGAVPFPLDEFSRSVDDCTAWKLSPASVVKNSVDWGWVSSACQFASLLWIWELRRMTGANTGLSATQLCLQLARQQTIAARVRSWLFVLRRRGWHRSVAEWPRWINLARHASPRYWLYAATGELCLRQANVLIGCNGPGLDPLSLGLLRDCLPMLPPDAAREPLDGKEIARAIAWNYHQFLEETRG
jgi:hypothetical protein